jgi:hypothetical protein
LVRLRWEELMTERHSTLHIGISDADIISTFRGFNVFREIVHQILQWDKFGVAEYVNACLPDTVTHPREELYTTNGLVFRLNYLPFWLATPFGTRHFSGGYYPFTNDFAEPILNRLADERIVLELMRERPRTGTLYRVKSVKDIVLPRAEIRRHAPLRGDENVAAFQAALELAAS